MGKSTNGTKTNNISASFRGLLKHWRSVRKLSQFDLAEEAGISTRHLSFLETGRSAPSRDMVLRLADSLDLPSADRNALLLAAGFAPIYPAESNDAEAFEIHEKMLDFILSQQKAVPALVIDERWNIRMRNAAADRVFAAFRPFYRLPENVANNAMHILCHPSGLRQFMANWTEYAEPFVREIDREASLGPGSPAEHLREALQGYPGMPEIADLWDGRIGTMQPPLTLRLEQETESLAFHTAFTTFVLPSALAPQNIRVECLYPADSATAAFVDRCIGPLN